MNESDWKILGYNEKLEIVMQFQERCIRVKIEDLTDDNLLLIMGHCTHFDSYGIRRKKIINLAYSKGLIGTNKG